MNKQQKKQTVKIIIVNKIPNLIQTNVKTETWTRMEKETSKRKQLTQQNVSRDKDQNKNEISTKKVFMLTKCLIKIIIIHQ